MTKKIVTPQDSDLFRQSIGEVRAIKSDKVPLNLSQQNKPKRRQESQNLEENLLEGSAQEIAEVSPEESLSYAVPGVQHNVLTKLRKGGFGIQAELDLHGLVSTAAKQQLLLFLQASRLAEHRCVCVIHGKGYRSSEQLPVLKNNLNRWLRQHKEVLAFCSAPQRQGGTGAVYVLLRQTKGQPEN